MGHYTQLVEQTLSENREKYADTPAGKLAEEMKKVVQKIFPKSTVYGGFDSDLSPGITIGFLLGKDRNEFSNGIEHNDPARTIFSISGSRGVMDNDGNILADKMVLERISGYGFYLNDYERHKIGFRKTTGDSKKMITAIKKYFEKLKKELQANKENVQNIDLIKDKF